jgi:hypothetical protein
MNRAASWIFILVFVASNHGGFLLAPQVSSSPEKLYVRAGRLVSLTDTEAVLSGIGPDGLPQKITFAINVEFNPPPVKMGETVIAMYAKRGSRRILMVINGRQIKPSEPPSTPVENLGVAEVSVPEALSAEVLNGIPTIQARGPHWNEDAHLHAAAPASASSGEGREGGPGHLPYGVVTGVKILNSFDVEVQVQGLTTPLKFVVNFFTQVNGVLRKGAFVEVVYYKEGGRNIATEITIEPNPSHTAH